MPCYFLLQKSKTFFFLFILVFTWHLGNTQTQKPVLTLPVGRPNGSVEFSRDGKLLVTGSHEGYFIIWDARTGFMIRRVNTGRAVQQVVVMPGNTQAITVAGNSSNNYTLQKWDLLTGNLLAELPFTSSKGLQFLPGSGYLLTPGYSTQASGDNLTLLDKFKQMSDNEDYEDSIEQVFEARMEELVNKGEIEKVEDITDTEKLAAYQKKAMEVKMELLTGTKRSISILDSKTMKPVASLSIFPEHIQPLVYKNTEYLITAYEQQTSTISPDNKITVWDIKKSISQSAAKEKISPVKEFIIEDAPAKLVTSSAKGFFATGTNKNTIQLWQMDSKEPLVKLVAKGNELYSIAFSPGGDTLYSYSGYLPGRYIEAWSTTTFKQLFSVPLPDRYIGEDLHLSPGGNYFTLVGTSGLTKLSLTGDSIAVLGSTSGTASRFGFGENDESIIVRYNELPNILSPEMVRYFKKEIEEEAAKDGKKLSAAEIDKLFEEQTRVIRTMYASPLAKSFSLNWNLLKGGAMPGKNYEGPFKLTSTDKKYSLINEKYETPGSKTFRTIMEPQKPGNKKKQKKDDDDEDNDEKKDSEEAIAIQFMMDPKNGFTNVLSADSLNGQVTSLVNHATKDTVSFISIDSTDWVMLLKNGYYMTSKNGARALNYTRGLEVFPFEQFDIQYNRPDLLLKAIGKADPSLIEAYRNAYLKRVKKLGIDTTSFKKDFNMPESDFANRDKISYEQKTGKLNVTINASDKKAVLDRYNIWVNDVPVFGSKGKSIKAEKLQKLNVPAYIMLSPGKNRVEVSVTNESGVESYRTPLFVSYTPEAPVKENVYFIGIGISRFSDTVHNLRYCEKDIRDLSQKLKEKYGAALQANLLFNEEVTAENIKALKQKLLQSSENDKVIIAYSGHGLLSKNYDYYLSTYSVNFDNPEVNGLPYDELENLVDSIKARKKLLLIDACHSGELDKDELQKITSAQAGLKTEGVTPNNKGVKLPAKSKLGMGNSFALMQELFVNIGRGTGTTIIAAAGGTEFAQERNELKNGVFTYAVLELMNRSKTITVNELKRYVNSRVYELTKGLQQPVARNEIINTDWMVW